jgi:methionine synthase II (cobalamin-independent)
MFATLLGGLPRPSLAEGASLDALVEAAVRAQETAGLDPVTDGGLYGEERPVETWRATAALTDRAVKQALTGPYTAGRARGADVLARARALNVVLRQLAAAGCPLVEIHEPAATAIGDDPAERELFSAAHRILLDGMRGTHLSLAITGGNADRAGIATILAAPYASLAVDLITGPDNWRLVVETPGDRGIVCGALAATDPSDDGPEILLWAAGYAASTGGRGPERVGLATASSLADLPWPVAVRKMERLGEAARLADLPARELVQHLDPRAVSKRSAALGRVEWPEPVQPVEPVESPPSHGPEDADDPT